MNEDLSSNWQPRPTSPRLARNRIFVSGGDPGEPEIVRINLLSHSAAFFSKSPGEWMFSLARPVFLICSVTLLLSIIASCDRMLRYVGYPLASSLLPLLGVALGLICFLGKDLDAKFKKTAAVVAALTLLAGVIAPAIQD